jgi:CrcB protein
MNVILQIALGGALGAVLRYGTVQGVARLFVVGTPMGTMFVNVLGSFIMGLFAVWLLERIGDAKVAPFIMTGVLGGFTTFSAFSLDAIALWEQGRQAVAMAYVMGSVFGAILALLAGVLVMRAILT